MKSSSFAILACIFMLEVFSSFTTTTTIDPAQGPPTDRKWIMVWNDGFDGSGYDATRWFLSKNEHN